MTAAHLQHQALHTPVLLREVVTALAPTDGGTYLDATFGNGGYTTAILEAAACAVIAIDRDPDAIARGAGRLRGGCLGQQRLQLQRRAALGQGRIHGLGEPPERVQVQLARAIAVKLGEHLLRLRRVDLHAPPHEHPLQLCGVDVAASVGVEPAEIASEALTDVQHLERASGAR